MLSFLNSIGKASKPAFVPPSPPAASFSLFTYDADTHYWDMLAGSGNNTIEPTGSNTLAAAVDNIHGALTLVQPNKALQPFWTSTHGIDFNDVTARQMTFNNISTIANGHGYYFAGNFKFSTHGNSQILVITRNGSDNASRGMAYWTSSLRIGWKGTNNDGIAGVSWWGYTDPIPQPASFNQWYTVEISMYADGVTANPLKIWINGELKYLNAENASPFTIPATSPTEVVFGNQTNDIESLDGKIAQFAFRNANTEADSAIRESISAYLNAQRLLLPV